MKDGRYTVFAMHDVLHYSMYGWMDFVYSHDTQTTHWDHPRGMREQRLLKQIRDFLEQQKAQLEVCEIAMYPVPTESISLFLANSL